MSNKREIKAFNQFFFREQLRDSRIGALVVASTFSIFLYADLKVYHYPTLIAQYRVGLVVYYLSIFFLSYKLKYYKEVLGWLFKIGSVGLIYFTVLFKAVIEISVPDYNDRTSQVVIMVMIGMLIFSGLARSVLPVLFVTNILGYLAVEYLVKGFNMNGFYDYFNALFMTLMALIFNHLYIKSKHNEWNASKEMQQKIDELRIEILKRQVLENKLKDMVTYDPLTGCYSRRAGLNLLKDIVNLANEESNPLSICYLDIDHLKDVNDTYGHKVGDTYINEFVKTVKEHCRQTDFCIRLGGDEFLLVMPNTSLAAAEVVWLKIKSMMNEYSQRSNSHIHLGASHGLAEYFSNNYATIESFIDAADAKMYAEKKKYDKLRVR